MKSFKGENTDGNNKNVVKSIFNKHELGEDFYLLFKENKTEDTLHLEATAKQEYLQFHFCLEGHSTLTYNRGRYVRDVSKEKSIVLYNPEVALPIDLRLFPQSSYVILLIPIIKLHTYFSSEAHYINFLNKENRGKKYYQEHIITPTTMTVLKQLVQHRPSEVVADLFYKGKSLELLSYHFNKPPGLDLDKCPFLADEANVIKIKQAKEIIIERMDNPPTLDALAKEVQIPINNLKSGFKQVYGDSVFSFLLNYKLEYARQLLIESSLNVNEIGIKIGYSAASHFIAAFKKKYGVTPKKYMSSHNQMSQQSASNLHH